MKKRVLGVTLFVLSFAITGVKAECFDHKVWGKILKGNVTESGLVDYDGVRINKGGGNMIEYQTFVEIDKLANCTQNDKLAFWINVYNSNVFRLISIDPSVKQLSKDNEMYAKRFYAANKKLTLNKIKNRILRSDKVAGGPMPGLSIVNLDPRIHFALVDGTLGAPRIFAEPYTGKEVKEQLKARTIAFINNSNYVRLEEDQLVLSKIFQNFATDFDVFGGVGPFISNLLDGKKRSDAAAIKAKIKTDFPGNVKYVYDWTVNAKK